MRRAGKVVARGELIALALTWDGARWPARHLPPKARAFLAHQGAADSVPTPQAVAHLLADDAVNEIRICWVPQLSGGEKVMCERFPSPVSRRLGYRPVKSVPLDGMLGVVYRR